MLSLVTIGFGVDFWAWALLSPLGAATTPRHRPLSATWQAAALYSVAFGGYVAFSVYLPFRPRPSRPAAGPPRISSRTVEEALSIRPALRLSEEC